MLTALSYQDHLALNTLNVTNFFPPGTTEDGLSGSPTQASIKCRHDNISGMNFVDVSWQPPNRPGGQIEFYRVSVQFGIFYLRFSKSEGPSSVFAGEDFPYLRCCYILRFNNLGDSLQKLSS